MIISVDPTNPPARDIAVAFLGEDALEFRILPSSIRLPSGEVIGVSTPVYTPDVTGWLEIRFGDAKLRVLVYDPACLNLVPARQSSGRYGERTLDERKAVLRSVALFSDIAGGDVADVCHVTGGLAPYGA